MTFDDFFAYCQADACSRVFSTSVEPLEDEEYSFCVLRVDADAVVGDGELPGVIGVICDYVNFGRLFAAEFDGVAYEVLEQLRKLDVVEIDLRELRRR